MQKKILIFCIATKKTKFGLPCTTTDCFGLDKNELKSDTHLSKGIAIITERIDILQQSYPEKTFSITQETSFPDVVRKGHKVVIVVTIL